MGKVPSKSTMLTHNAALSRVFDEAVPVKEKQHLLNHRTEDAIRSHVLLCFMALMMGKYLEIKTGASIKQVRKQLWMIHEAQLLDEITGKTHIMRMDARQIGNPELIELLAPKKTH